MPSITDISFLAVALLAASAVFAAWAFWRRSDEEPGSVEGTGAAGDASPFEAGSARGGETWFLLDADGRISVPDVHDLADLPAAAASLRGQPLYRWVLAEDREALAAMLGRALASGSDGGVLRVLGSTGVTRACEVRLDGRRFGGIGLIVLSTREAGAPGALPPQVAPADQPADAGTVEVTTDLGRMGRFRVLLPRVAAGAGPDRKESGAPRSRVLLVHSDPSLVAVLSRVLAGRGHEVIAAATPSEARLQAASFPGGIDVLLEGLHLDDTNGPETSPQRGVNSTPLSVEGLADVVDRASGGLSAGPGAGVPARSGPGVA